MYVECLSEILIAIPEKRINFVAPSPSFGPTRSGSEEGRGVADKFDAATPEASVSKSEVKNEPTILMTAACFGCSSEVESKSF